MLLTELVICLMCENKKNYQRLLKITCALLPAQTGDFSELKIHKWNFHISGMY